MPSMLACVPHSPIMQVCARAPADEAQILAQYARCAAAIQAFNPELVITFGTDHFAAFFLNAVPAYCVGLAAVAVDDVGGFPGALNVPAELARQLLVNLRAAGFDPGVSYRMRVDHAFSQPLQRLTGALDRYPVIPLFIAALVPPFLSLSRTRQVGTAVGHFCSALGKRVLFLGSGGMSHHPTRYYPLIGEGSPEVAAWQLEGPRGNGLTEPQWFAKLHEDHVTGAHMLINGQRTSQDIKLNPDFDQAFLHRIVTGDLAGLEAMDSQAMFERAGLGSLELHTWVAALAAHLAAGGTPPQHAYYSPTLEYGIGFGMACSDAA